MLSLGYVPSGKLFKKYAQALKPYEDVCEAVRTGKLGLLETALDRRKARFVREGTYLVFEKLRLYSLRTLFKKIAEIQKDLEPEKANQVKLEMLSTAARLVSSNNNKNNNNSTSSTELLTYDLDEVECGVSELIHRRMVKGYISHKSRVVVLSKTDAFPKLSLIVANNSTM
jgi:nuclear mRNA export protein PCID2/THP1